MPSAARRWRPDMARCLRSWRRRRRWESAAARNRVWRANDRVRHCARDRGVVVVRVIVRVCVIVLACVDVLCPAAHGRGEAAGTDHVTAMPETSVIHVKTDSVAKPATKNRTRPSNRTATV